MLEKIPHALGEALSGLRAGLDKTAYHAEFEGAPAAIRVTSPAFADEAAMPARFTQDGEKLSPPLAWKNAPEGTKSYAITMRDLAGRGGLGVDHWVIYGIPASVTGFAEGEASKPSDKFVGGQNLPKTGLYFGPCAPPNTTYHHYVITLIATDLDPKALKPGLTIPELLNALKGHDKGATEIVALFKHP